MSTIEERVAALEARQNGQEAWLKSIDEKLDTVVAALNMGKGAWFAILKVGALLVAAATFLAWVGDHLHFWR